MFLTHLYYMLVNVTSIEVQYASPNPYNVGRLANTEQVRKRQAGRPSLHRPPRAGGPVSFPLQRQE